MALLPWWAYCVVVILAAASVVYAGGDSNDDMGDDSSDAGFTPEETHNTFFVGPLAGTSYRTPLSQGTNPVYKIGDNITATWRTEYHGIDIWLETYYPDLEGRYPLLGVNVTTGTYTWTPEIDDFPEGVTKGNYAVFHFTLYPTKRDDWQVTSHFFNLTRPTNPQLATQTAGQKTASKTPSSAPTQTKTSANDDSDLSRGAVAGIAIGATAAVALIGLGVGLVFWRRWKRTYIADNDIDDDVDEDKDKGETMATEGSHHHELQGDEAPVELSADCEVRRELEAGSTMRFPPPPPTLADKEESDTAGRTRGAFARGWRQIRQIGRRDVAST